MCVCVYVLAFLRARERALSEALSFARPAPRWRVCGSDEMHAVPSHPSRDAPRDAVPWRFALIVTLHVSPSSFHSRRTLLVPPTLPYSRCRLSHVCARFLSSRVFAPILLTFLACASVHTTPPPCVHIVHIPPIPTHISLLISLESHHTPPQLLHTRLLLECTVVSNCRVGGPAFGAYTSCALVPSKR